MVEVTVRAAAKLNLTLCVTGTAEHLHTLDMLCCSVNLFEYVTVCRFESIVLNCDNPKIPCDETNVAYKAAREFFKFTGIFGGAKIDIKKSVPVGSGMGGGSADAAAVLCALNRLYNTKLSLRQLCEIGIEVGSDVPLCIVGGLCRVKGIGDLITPINTPLKAHFVVVMAGNSVSTKEAYARFDVIGTDCRANTAAAIAAINKPEFTDHLVNELEYSSRIYYAAAKQRFLCLGADKSLMTGSGAAVFGFFYDAAKAALAAATLKKENSSVFLLSPCAYGVEIL